MKKTLSLALVSLGILTASAQAHEGAAMQAGFGGQMAAAGDLHVEFIVRDGFLRAWVRDHDDKPVAATGKATLLVGGKKIDAAFAPAAKAEDGLTAPVPVEAGARLTAVLSLTAAGKPFTVRFAHDAVARPALSPQAQAGAQLFGEICATCHGTALRGTEQGPPLLHPLYGPASGHGDDTIVAAATGGAKSHMWKFGDMPKPEGVKPGQEKDLVAFIRAMQAANGLAGAAPTATPAAANPHAGHH
jgi:mono/diheme cytochrome c family protein